MSSNPRLPASRLTSVLLPSGKVLVVGGDTAELYDPEQDTWTATGSLLEPRYEHTMSLLPSGQVLVAGGVGVASNAVLASGERILASAELYDPATGTWSATASLANRRARHTATALPSGKVLVVAGWVEGYGKGNGVVPSAEIYDPASDSWTRIPAWGRFAHAATLLPSGKVLVVGGMGFTNFVTEVELFDPEMNTKVDVARLPARQLAPISSLLLSGKVLVAGATAGSHAQVYDPATDTWAQTADLNRPRAVTSSGATLLPSGKVLVVGGSADAELYDPGTTP